eukprot:4270645-Amphidinium_carterae.1
MGVTFEKPLCNVAGSLLVSLLGAQCKETIYTNFGGELEPTPAPGGIAGTGVMAFVQPCVVRLSHEDRCSECEIGVFVPLVLHERNFRGLVLDCGVGCLAAYLLALHPPNTETVQLVDQKVPSDARLRGGYGRWARGTTTTPRVLRAVRQEALLGLRVHASSIEITIVMQEV